MFCNRNLFLIMGLLLYFKDLEKVFKPPVLRDLLSV